MQCRDFLPLKLSSCGTQGTDNVLAIATFTFCFLFPTVVPIYVVSVLLV